MQQRDSAGRWRDPEDCESRHVTGCDFTFDALARLGAKIAGGTRCRLWQVSLNRQTESGERSERRSPPTSTSPRPTPRLCSLRSVPRHAVHARISYPPFVNSPVSEYPLLHLLDSSLILHFNMFSSSPTNEPLAGYPHGRAHAPHPGRKYPAELHPIPMPVLTRSATQVSAASCSSTTDLLPHHTSPRKNRSSLKERVTSWYLGRPSQAPESNEGNAPPAAPVKKERLKLKAWHGWKHVLLGSCTRLSCLYRY